MQADTFRWSMDSAGDWLCIQTKDARRTLDSLKPGKVYDVEIKEHQKSGASTRMRTSGFWLIGWLKSCGFPKRKSTDGISERSAAIMKWSA